MKRSIFIMTVSCLTISGAFAQNADDALRYSQIFYNGTARFISMGGAFTALGGDLSTLTQNPAGIAVFRSSEFAISPQLFHTNTSANFNGLSKDYLYNFNLGQIGVVGSIISGGGESGLVSLNVGYSFNKTNNLNTAVTIDGISNNSSLADYWAGISDGTYYTDISGAAGIAFDAYILDTIPVEGGGSYYGTVFNNYGASLSSTYGQRIRRLISNEGYTGEHAISIGANLSNKLFLGATIGINTIRYTNHYEHLEKADNPIGVAGFENFTYTEHYEDNGTGINLKLGAIFKPIEMLRIGVAFHTPTYFRINEYYTDNIISNTTAHGELDFSNQATRFNYALTTPFRVLAGVAVQIEKLALLSADYEFVDYSSASFSQTGDHYDYSEKNQEIKSTLKPAHNVRLGGELRFNKAYLRGGFGYYGKVFQTGELNQNMYTRSISAGVGYREQNISIDFGFANMKNLQDYILYNYGTNLSQSAVANLDNMKNMFVLTLGYKFGY